MDDDRVESEREASPFFGGSIAEAIQIAKMGKKTLIVYISGENDDCLNMDQSTWKNLKVQKLLREQFVTLCLPERSRDAKHFSAMYPYHGVPNISVINSSGMRLKHLEGYIQPEEFLGILEQLLSVQAAATIVAALASANASSASFSTQNQAISTMISSEKLKREEGSSSAMHDDIRTPCSPKDEKIVDDNDGEISIPSSSQVHCLDGTSECQEGEIIVRSEDMNAVSNPGMSEPDTEQALDSSQCNVWLCEGTSSNAAALKDLDIDGNDQNTNMDAIATHNRERISNFQEEAPKVQQAVGMFLIQVRLTNGKCVQKDYDPKDKLAAVKTFIDQNRDDGNDAYSLAVPYPRKVFTREDMDKSLLELSLKDRSTLVLVSSSLQPKFPASQSSVEQAATRPEVEASGSTGGIWKLFSYLNPLSYFSANSDGSNHSATGSSSWQYEPNSNLQTSIHSGTTERHHQSNADVSETDTSKRKKSQEKSWGGNIHTLRHNENDEAFKRGNAFWNGNSTQYGGDDSQK